MERHKMRTQRLVLAALLTALAATPESITAQSCNGWNPTHSELVTAIRQMPARRVGLADLQTGQAQGCLGDLAADPSPLAKLIAARFDELTGQADFETTWPLRRDAARELVHLIVMRTAIDPRSGPITGDLLENLTELESVLQGALTEPAAIDDRVQRLFDPDSWAYRAMDDSGEPHNRPFAAKAHWTERPQPLPAGDPDVDQAAAQFLDLLVATRSTNLTQLVLRATTQDLRTTLTKLDALSAQWTTYFEHTRSQYLPELLLNSRRVAKGCSTDVRGRGIGWCEVPTSQIILLHPDVVLEYVSDADDGQQLDPALVFEVVGFNRWSWSTRAGEEGVTRGAIGASLAVTYSDRAGVDDIGVGLLIHVAHKYSLGATYREDGWGIVASADLARAWTRVSERAQNLIKRGKGLGN